MCYSTCNLPIELSFFIYTGAAVMAGHGSRPFVALLVVGLAASWFKVRGRGRAWERSAWCTLHEWCCQTCACTQHSLGSKHTM